MRGFHFFRLIGDAAVEGWVLLDGIHAGTVTFQKSEGDESLTTFGCPHAPVALRFASVRISRIEHGQEIRHLAPGCFIKLDESLASRDSTFAVLVSSVDRTLHQWNRRMKKGLCRVNSLKIVSVNLGAS